MPVVSNAFRILIALVVTAGALLILPRELASIALVIAVLALLLASIFRIRRSDLSNVKVLRLLQQMQPLLIIVTGGVGISLLLLAAWMFHPDQSVVLAQSAITVTGLGGLAVGVLLHRDRVLVQPPGDTHSHPAVRWRLVLLGLCAVLMVVQVHFLMAARNDALISHHLQMALLLGGWVLVAWGLCGAPGLQHIQWRPSAGTAALGIILLIALFVRTWDLAEGVHRWIDEINFLFGIDELSLAPNQPILNQFGGITAFTWFFPYIQWWWQAVFGPSLESVRMPAVLFGVAQVAALYWMMKPIAGVRVALISALLMATFPPSVHFSRMGINNIADPLFGILAFGCVIRGFQSGQRRHYVLAGLALGLTHYFYEGGRLFYSLFMACWLAWLWLMLRRPRRKGYGGLVGLVTYAAATLPVYAVWLFDDRSLIPRLNAVGKDIRTLIDLSRTVQVPSGSYTPVFGPLLSYVHLPDTGSFFPSDVGFLLPMLTPFFLLGLIMCAWRLRTLGGSLLFWWCIGAAVANLVVNNQVDAPRYVVVFPALCAVAALGIDRLWVWLERWVPRVRWRPIIALGLAAVTLVQGHYYLVYYMPEFYERQFSIEMDPFRRVQVRDGDDMILRAIRLNSPVEVYAFAPGFLNTFAFGATTAYFRRSEATGFVFRWDYSDRIELTLEQAGPSDTPKAFFIEPLDTETRLYLISQYSLYGPFYSPHRLPRSRQFALYVTDLRVLPDAWRTMEQVIPPECVVTGDLVCPPVQ